MAASKSHGKGGRVARLGRGVSNGYKIVTTAISIASVLIALGSWRFPEASPVQVHLSQRIQVLIFGRSARPTPKPTAVAATSTPGPGGGQVSSARGNGEIKPGVSLAIEGVHAYSSFNCPSGTDVTQCEVITVDASNQTSSDFTARLDTSTAAVTDDAGGSYPVVSGGQFQADVPPSSEGDYLFQITVNGWFSTSANTIQVVFPEVSSYQNVAVSYQLS
jgi:hypothetical protein